jgi:hypothetical protein
MAPKGMTTYKALQDLHPEGRTPEQVPPNWSPTFTYDVVKQALASFGPAAGGGLFAYTPFLLRQCFRAESHSFGSVLVDLVNYLAEGRAPSFLRPFLAGGVSIALSKPNSSVRPLCCGDPLRRLVAKCFCIVGKQDIAKVFEGKNYGVGCPGGVEVVAHSLRDFLQRHADSNLALLKIDFKNAFNLVTEIRSGRLPAQHFQLLQTGPPLSSFLRPPPRDLVYFGGTTGGPLRTNVLLLRSSFFSR